MINVYKIIAILLPTYITAYLTDKMIYVIPMLAACTLIASTSFERDKRSRRLDEDGYKKDIQDLGSRKDHDSHDG
jgi:hypothetical protein